MGSLSAKSVKESLDCLIDNLNISKTVYYTRFGDGDLNLMNDDIDQRHRHSYELSCELCESFSIKHPFYMIAASAGYPKEHGMSPGMFIEGSTAGKNIDEFKWKAMNITSNIEFYNPIVFHYLSVYNKKSLKSFFKNYIRDKKTMYIGCNNKDSMELIYGDIDFYVETPSYDAYYSIDRWWPDVIKSASKCEVILPSAGVASRVIAKRLWEEGVDAHVIDIGSLNDAIDDNVSRTWIMIAGIDKIKKGLIDGF